MDALIQGAATPLAIAGIFGAMYAAKFWREWIKPAPVALRRDGRIPARERELLGDDWRDCLRSVDR